VPVKPAAPAPASPAATLVLLRDAPGHGLETLLIRRHDRSRFAAGDHVFPGGRIEREDIPPDAGPWCAGVGTAEAARALGVSDGRLALAYWVGAIREAFEEVGVLLAYAAGGRMLGDSGEPAPPARLEGWRRACHADHRVLWDMLRAEGLTLAADRLVYFAHWITPEERPIRFDTRFFAAPAPPGQEPIADGREIVDLRWLPPAEALAARARGEISLRLPTMKNLALLAEWKSAGDALAQLGRGAVPTIRPRLVGEGPSARSLLPGDAGYY
jgi:8-oxo-dGTP pyrophosphatase MutT (NUDIX family)